MRAAAFGEVFTLRGVWIPITAVTASLCAACESWALMQAKPTDMHKQLVNARDASARSGARMVTEAAARRAFL